MKRCIITVCLTTLFVVITVTTFAQNNPTFTLNGAINTTNNISFSAATAGENPMNLTTFNRDNSNTNNTRMNFKYKWPFYGTEDEVETYLIGSVRVSSSIAVPSGLQWTIQAQELSSTYGQYGTSTGVQVLGTTQVYLVEGIWSTASGWFPFIRAFAQTLTNTMTQTLTVTNFADIHPTPGGNYQTIVLTFGLY